MRTEPPIRRLGAALLLTGGLALGLGLAGCRNQQINEDNAPEAAPGANPRTVDPEMAPRGNRPAPANAPAHGGDGR